MRCALHLRQAWLVNNPRPPGLFIPQRLHRIGQGNSDCLITDCEQCDCESQKSGKYERPETNTNTICKALEPLVHCVKSNRPSDDVGYQHPLRKLCGKKINNVGSKRLFSFKLNNYSICIVEFA